ncbi:iron-hydroxamate ABC transporter substrate-binding protein [Gorillibacterium sp. sgz5001074]|uniref:iron-hydroxamate ABC transporter substrate-binding protein n=1 Tax=Gorillibacterium sp. sgz5001074 TaxID=3446695 RepID=UPI003F667AE5
MNSIHKTLGCAALASILLLSACGEKNDSATTSGAAASSPTATAAATAAASAGAGEKKPEASAAVTAGATRTVTYLNKTYTIPAKTEKLVITGSLEAMEDALVLGVKPAGGITVGGKFPAMFAPITGSTESIGEKSQPNVETILKLKPDVILGTSKFPADVSEKLVKIAPTFPVSHLSTDWEANLNLLAELTGKQAQAKQAIDQYKSDLEAAKARLGEKLKDKKVVAIRIRAGSITIYRDEFFFNPSLYKDLGLKVPDQIKAAQSQETVSLEKFSEINPDYIFLQFSEDENKDKPKSLEDLQNNPIWKSMNAVKNNKVFVNVVDPLAQGGTAWSKISFLKAAVENLSK